MFSKRRVTIFLVVLLGVGTLCLPTPRIYLCGASVTHLKSGEWVVSGPSIRMTDARFRWLVHAINSHGNISCMRLSTPNISDEGFAPASKLDSLSWLFIEDSQISDDALEHFCSLSRLGKLYFDRCPNLTDAKLNWLRSELPDCNIRVDAYTP